MRDPCPYCGLRDVSRSRVDLWAKEIVREIREHACFAWEPKEPLVREPTDTTFIREARNTQEGLRVWRENR